MDCVFCGAGLSNRGAFCKNCGRQVRCKNCGDVLEVDARACVLCGTRVGESLPIDDGAIVASDAGNAASVAVNTLEIEETRTTRSLKAKFTDKAVDSFAEVLGMSVLRGITAPVQRVRATTPSEGSSSFFEQKGLPLSSQTQEVPEDQSEIIDSIAVAAPASSDQSSDRERLRKVFISEGDKLRLQNSRLKASTQADYAERVVCLFLYAHELDNNNLVSRSSVNEVLKEAKVYNGNARTMLASSINLIRGSGGTLGLSVPGRERAVAILDALDDEHVQGTWTPSGGRRTSASKGKTSDTGEDDGTKARIRRRGGRQPSTTVEKWVAAWKLQQVAVIEHSVLNSMSLADKAIIGMWAIRRAAGQEGQLVTRGQLARFLYSAFQLQTSERSIENALNGLRPDKVLNPHGVTFEITDTGMTYAAQKAQNVVPVAKSTAQETTDGSA